MRLRTNLVEQFSTFAQISDGRFQVWVSDPRLKRSLEKRLTHPSEIALSKTESPAAQERRWALYWYERWQSGTDNLAKNHLFAYLQEPCFWASREVTQKYASLKAGASSGSELGDYFQMAMTELGTALAKFQPDRSSQLRGFIQVFLSSKLKATLRQQKQADFCTPWALLRKTSARRLREVLTDRGLAADERESYGLLLMGFKELYVPVHAGGSAKLPKPDEELWESLTAFYNQRRSSLNSPNTALSRDNVENAISQIAQWTRNYLYPRLDSLNRKRQGDEGEVGELQDRLSDSEHSSLMEALEVQESAQERRATQQELRQILAETYSQLDDSTQQILILLYKKGLSQTEVSHQTQISQATVSRKAKRARKQLQKAMQTWLEQTMHRFPEPDQLKDVTNMLEEWLRVYLTHSDGHD